MDQPPPHRSLPADFPHQRSGQEAFPGKGNLSSQEDKIRQLEQQVKRLTMEREILKKAMAYFVEIPK